MKIIHKEKTEKFNLTDTSTVIEYPMNDKDINIAIADINGRYPAQGRTVNEVCKEMCYIISGEGKAFVEGKEIDLKEGSSILIDIGEKYYFEGNMQMFMPCTPAWYPEQHKDVE